uniref:Uncharacterized protein n=2 Tax=Clastoptera arizonana TaxID=38151 RepID=A0A1B6CPQ5_9HEMI
MFKSDNIWNTDIWHSTILFVDPEKLKSGGRKETNGQVAEGIYSKIDGQWVNIARDECEVKNQNFTKQSCHIGMGQHYAYKMTPTIDCKQIQPFAPVYNKGQLIGFGLFPFGSYSPNSENLIWFESSPRYSPEHIISNGPTCLTQWFKLFDVSSIHIYLTSSPRWTNCPFWERDDCKK